MTKLKWSVYNTTKDRPIAKVTTLRKAVELASLEPIADDIVLEREGSKGFLYTKELKR